MIRRRLEKLERLGYIRRLRVNKTTFAFVINRMIVSNSVRQDFAVNAALTTDWRHPVYESVKLALGMREASVKLALGMREASVNMNENVDTEDTEEMGENVENDEQTSRVCPQTNNQIPAGEQETERPADQSPASKPQTIKQPASHSPAPVAHAREPVPPEPDPTRDYTPPPPIPELAALAALRPADPWGKW